MPKVRTTYHERHLVYYIRIDGEEMRTTFSP